MFVEKVYQKKFYCDRAIYLKERKDIGEIILHL